MLDPLVSGLRSEAIIAPSKSVPPGRRTRVRVRTRARTRREDDARTTHSLPEPHRALGPHSPRRNDVGRGDPGHAGPHRRPRRRSACLLGRDGRCGHGGGGGRGRGDRRREHPRPAPRGAGRGEGSLPDEGSADPGGDAPSQRLRAGLRQHRGGAVPRGGGGPVGQARAHRGRVRLPSPRRRGAGEPVEPGLCGRAPRRAARGSRPRPAFATARSAPIPGGRFDSPRLPAR